MTGDEVSWTEKLDGSTLFNNDAVLCVAYSLEASLIAMKNGIEYDVEPETYVDRHSFGVQPTGAEFLQFLSKLGFDPKEVHESVVSSVEMTEEGQLNAIEKAATFFHIFQTEWHVLNEQVTKYIDEDLIYYLLELAVANVASTRARLNAIMRHSEDPKQLDKAKVRECWDEWIRKQSSAGGEHFARLEINQAATIKKLLLVTSNRQLDDLFASAAT